MAASIEKRSQEAAATATASDTNPFGRSTVYQHQHNPNKSGSRVAKQYNLMRHPTGGQLITSMDDDVAPGATEGLRYYSGSVQNDKAASEKDKVRKSFELMTMFTK